MAFELTEVPRPKGFNSDLSPYELPADVWVTSLNIDNANLRSNKAKGASSRYGPLSLQPLFTMPWNDEVSDVWVYAGDTSVYKVDSTEVNTLMGSGYSSNVLTGWSGDVFNGVAILNNGVDLPQYSNTATSFTDLANWPVSTTAHTIRPFKNYLIAMDITKGIVPNPAMVKWSSPADPGSVPPSWDESDPAEQAGENSLADTLGSVIDGKALGNSFIVYKEDSVWAMDFIGGAFVFQFRKLFDDVNGILAKDCVVEFEGKHFVLAKGDAYIHDGTTKRSVMSSRVSSSLFGLIDNTYWEKTRVVADPSNQDIWIYYVPQNSPTGLATKALVYNWGSDAWSERDLLDVSFIANGIIADAITNDWGSDSNSWESDTTFWDQDSSTPAESSLLACDYTNSQLLELNSGTTWDGDIFTSRLEKTGVDFGDDSSWKKINSIYPSMTGSGTVNFFVGHEDPKGSGVTWEGPYPYTIGEDVKINCRVNGRNIAIKTESTSEDIWSLSGLTIEWKPTRAKR